MNKQVNYIISAHLILATVTGIFLVAKNFPSTLISENDTTDRINIEASSVLSAKAQQGQTLFRSKCASCHRMDQRMTGPALAGFEDRGPWKDSLQLYQWIKNPEVFMKNNKYTQELKAEYNSMMMAFPSITMEEVEAIREYINSYSTNIAIPQSSK